MSLLQRFLKNDYTAVMLAPARAEAPHAFGQVTIDPWRYCILLRAVQRVRAISYLHRGLISVDDLATGQTYPTKFDAGSWHFVVFKHGQIVGFIKNRLFTRTVPLDALKTYDSIERLPAAEKAVYGDALIDFIQSSQSTFPQFGESSSWVTLPEKNSASIGMVLVLSTFAFYAFQGHALGVAVSRADNGAAKILTAICGKPLGQDGQVLPAYYDPFYKAQQRVLTFDTRQVSAKFCRDVDQIMGYLSNIDVYYPGRF